jgi:hypothetical protein
VHIGALDVSNVIGIPAAYSDPRMRTVSEKSARACRSHVKAMGVGGARGDGELQRYLIGLGVRYLTTGSDVGFVIVRGNCGRHCHSYADAMAPILFISRSGEERSCDWKNAGAPARIAQPHA